MRDTERRVNANRLNGVDAEFLTPAQIKEIEPTINLNSRYPVLGASIQRRAAWRVTTRWPGASHAARTARVSTSSRTAR